MLFSGVSGSKITSCPDCAVPISYERSGCPPGGDIIFLSSVVSASRRWSELVDLRDAAAVDTGG